MSNERQPVMIDISGILASDTRSVSIHMPDGKRLTMRVVDEVQYDRGGCLKCGNVDDHGTQWKTWVSCPGCGNKIKR